MKKPNPNTIRRWGQWRTHKCFFSGCNKIKLNFVHLHCMWRKIWMRV